VLEELKTLIQLQETDNKLSEMNDEKGDLPEQLERIKNEMQHYSSSIEEAGSDFSDLVKEKKQIESNLISGRESYQRSQSVIFSVKTTREYDAISSEIEQAKSQIETGEKKESEIKTRIKDLELRIRELKSKLAELEEEYESRKSEMQDRLGDSQDKELLLQHEREKCIMKLKKPVSAHYERIRKIRDGIGVSYITGDACSYCYSVLPPQRQAEIRKMEDLFLCEVCGCIIVSEEYASQLDMLL